MKKYIKPSTEREKLITVTILAVSILADPNSTNDIGGAPEFDFEDEFGKY